MRLRVAGPAEFAGDVMGDVHTRRARKLEMQLSEDICTVVAYVPQPELMNYANDLHNMSQGRATYHTQFSHYQEWGSDDEAGGGAGVPSPLKPVPPTLSAGAAAEPSFDEP